MLLADTGQTITVVVVTPLLTALLVFGALYPITKGRREKARKREDRIGAGIDVVLGRPADPERGLYRAIPSLVDTVDSIHAAVAKVQTVVGTINGAPISEHIHDLETSFASLHRKVDDHNRADSERFESIERSVNEIRDTVRGS